MSSAQFWSHWAWPFATSIIGAFFTVLLTRQYLARRRMHQLAWSVGFLFYTVAAFMEAFSEYSGIWYPAMYRIYIVLAASLVGFLGLGVLCLIIKKQHWGHIFLVYCSIMFIVFVVGTFTHPLIEERLVAGITVGGKALGESMTFPRFMSLFFNIPGTIFLLGGAIYSIVRFSGKKEYSFRVWANVFIALGTLIIAGAGSMARAGRTIGLYPAEMLGAALLLWGFLKASTLKSGIQRAARREQNRAD